MYSYSIFYDPSKCQLTLFYMALIVFLVLNNSNKQTTETNFLKQGV